MFVQELRHLFLWSSGHSVKKKIAKLLKKSAGTMTEQVVKSKNLRRQTKEWMAVFFTKCVRNIIDNAVSVCVITPQNRKLKKFQLHIIDQSFEHNGMGISYHKKLKALKRKRRCTLHASMVSGRICQHYTKGGPAGKLM